MSLICTFSSHPFLLTQIGNLLVHSRGITVRFIFSVLKGVPDAWYLHTWVCIISLVIWGWPTCDWVISSELDLRTLSICTTTHLPCCYPIKLLGRVGRVEYLYPGYFMRAKRKRNMSKETKIISADVRHLKVLGVRLKKNPTNHLVVKYISSLSK